METLHHSNPKRASIRDVAREAGVSHTTVSLILNGKVSGAPETRQRVLAAVEQLNYQPDALFRKAVTERSRLNQQDAVQKPLTKCLALILPRWLDQEGRNPQGYYHGLITGVMDAAAAYGYSILLCPQENKPGGIPSVIQDDKVDGILFSGTFSEDWVNLLSRRLPCVYFDRCYPGLNVIFVTTNWLNSARTQIEYAWNHGHRNFAFFQYDSSDTHLVGTYRGFLATLERLGGHLLHPQLSRLRDLNEGQPAIIEAFVNEWLQCEPRPTVIFSVDSAAVLLTQALRRRNISVPEDVSIIGRMGDIIGTINDPPLTSYEYPTKEIARSAVSMVVEAIQTGKLHPAHLMLEGRLIERSSVRDLSLVGEPSTNIPTHTAKSPSPKSSRSQKAFSLLEFLVTAAIIIVMLALAAPLFSKISEASQASKCINNLKMVGSCILAFSADHQGRILPRKLSDTHPEAGSVQSYWVRRLIHEKYIISPIDGAPINKSLFCPSLLPEGHPQSWEQSYGLRVWSGTKTNGADNYLKTTLIPEPSRFFLLADSISINTKTQWYTIQFNSGNTGIHLRHANRANAFFADGHVSATDADYFRGLPSNEPEFTNRPFNIIDHRGEKL